MAEDLGETWRVLEFYSGIGGMRYSLKKAGVNAKVVEAFDINDTANDVYEHNFGHRPYQGNIQSLTAADLDSYDAHAWLLSPPCQPYTRQGLQKHSSDARAFSFLKMLELIPHTAKPPIMLFVENVVGFEKSDTHAQMIEILAKSDFITQEFILSPLQFGVPYSRPRYFCLAKKRRLMFHCHHFNNQLLWFVTPVFENNENAMLSEQDQSHPPYDKLLDSCEPIETFLEHETSIENVPVEDDSLPADSMCNDVQTTKIAGGNGCSFSSLDQYAVPKRLIERWGKAMGILVFLFTFIDAGYYTLSYLLLYVSFLEKFLTELDIVYPDSKRCCCFTKSYYRYVKGTGSLLAKVQIKGQEKTTSEEPCLRYFTPREVANLHSFPEDFRFPQHVGLRQRYALLGNSLSIAVVAPLLRYLFSHPS